MEEVLIRFPVVGLKIFKQLDDKGLMKCRKVGKTWRVFLDDDSIFWRRRIQKYAKNQTEFQKDWNLVTTKISVEILKEFTLAVEEFYKRCDRSESQHSPLYIGKPNLASKLYRQRATT